MHTTHTHIHKHTERHASKISSPIFAENGLALRTDLQIWFLQKLGRLQSRDLHCVCRLCVRANTHMLLCASACIALSVLSASFWGFLSCTCVPNTCCTQVYQTSKHIFDHISHQLLAAKHAHHTTCIRRCTSHSQHHHLIHVHIALIYGNECRGHM